MNQDAANIDALLTSMAGSHGDAATVAALTDWFKEAAPQWAVQVLAALLKDRAELQHIKALQAGLEHSPQCRHLAVTTHLPPRREREQSSIDHEGVARARLADRLLLDLPRGIDDGRWYAVRLSFDLRDEPAPFVAASLGARLDVTPLDGGPPLRTD